MSLASLGAIAGGINQGMDMNRRDRALEDQRAAQEERLQLMRQQRKALADEQAREERFSSDMQAASAPTKKVKQSVPDAGAWERGEVGPDGSPIMVEKEVDVPRSRIEIARAQGDAMLSARKYDEAKERFTWADQQAQKSAAQSLYAALRSLSANASLEQIARAAALAVDSDASPIGIDLENLAVDKETGAITVPMYNRLTGYKTTQTFADKRQLQDALQWHFDPEGKSAMEARELDAAAKLKFERSKPYELRPGGMRVDPVTGKTVRNDTGYINVGTDENPQMVPVGRAGAGAAGAGKGGKPQDPLKSADDAWEFSSTKGETKLQPNQLATGLRMTRSMAADGVDPALAAEVALEVSTDPTKARLELNTETGTVDLVYRNPRVNGGRAIAISRNAGSMKEFESSVEGGPKAVKAQVQNMVTQAYGQNADRMIAIANDPELSRQYLESARERGMDTGPIANRLNLMRTYLAPASRQAAPASQPTQSRPLIDRLRTGFGINGASRGETDPNSPAGRFQARNAEAAKREDERRAQRSQAAAQLSEQFKKDAKTMDPLELVGKYDGQRMKLSSRDAAELRRIEEQAFRTSK